MSVIRCKMCGAALMVGPEQSVAECEYCGSPQTIPRISDSARLAQFERANAYRASMDFDRAMVVYESILNDSPEDYEANWGSCLCRYGIEYVEDPRSRKRIPTCHRTQFKSILTDPNYLAAIRNAPLQAKMIYEQEAAYIDQVQKQILNISNKEEPFDIFICYKESDAYGNRTIDSQIAQDIYTSLTEDGYKVFFSRITLEDKLGMAYEPYIFAALNSAKIMLVVGTKVEHFNAVWVRNEWSRYLSLIEHGQKKYLIPCYRDIDPYELPAEFRALQSQDLSKIGYMQDLSRGIQKLMDEVAPAQQKQETPVGPQYQYQNQAQTQQNNLPPIMIRHIKSIGARNQSDVWPSGTFSSVINRDQFPAMAFHIHTNKIGFYGRIMLTFRVFDSMGNLVLNDVSAIDVQPNYDKLSKVYILRGSDGTVVNAGDYRAQFSINNGAPFSYNFRIICNSVNQNRVQQNIQYMTQQGKDLVTQIDQVAQQLHKRRTIYLILCFFVGTLGVHRFYAKKKGTGILMLIMTITGTLTGISFIWAIIDFVSALTNKDKVI